MYYSSAYGHLGSFYEHSSIHSDGHMHSFLVVNLSVSEISKPKGYAYVQPE